MALKEFAGQRAGNLCAMNKGQPRPLAMSFHSSEDWDRSIGIGAYPVVGDEGSDRGFPLVRSLANCSGLYGTWRRGRCKGKR